MLRQAVIVSGVRTAIGSFGGTLSNVPASRLGAVVVKEAVRRAGIEVSMVDEVIMGNVIGAGQGQNIARQAAVYAGIPVEVPCMTVNKVCGSGLKAVVLAAQAIAAGDADVVVAGGTENMNMAPYLLLCARFGYRMGHAELIDSMISDGLWCIWRYPYGITAEIVAERWGLPRSTRYHGAPVKTEQSGHQSRPFQRRNSACRGSQRKAILWFSTRMSTRGLALQQRCWPVLRRLLRKTAR